MWLKTKEFLKQNESKTILVAGFILVAVLSFEAGILKGQTIKQNPVVVKEAESQAVCGASSSQAPVAQNLASDVQNVPASSQIPVSNCAFVGSKNSNKYHLPTCRWAKNIKPENLVCFKDENEAKSKGYQPDKNCIK